uniref:Uncharacterized protein n=1 Tax=Bionectria ochroleuca TaxID=29856 RepID=A0A8H7MYB1_BIOOC
MAFMKKGFPAQMLFLITLVVCFIGRATADLASWDDVLDVRGIEDIDYDTFDLQRRDEEESYLEVRGGNTPPVSPLTSTPPGSPRPVSPLSRHSSTKSNDRKDAGSGSKSSGGLHRSNAVRRKKNTKRSNTPPVSPLTSTPPGSPRPVSPCHDTAAPSPMIERMPEVAASLAVAAYTDQTLFDARRRQSDPTLLLFRP